MGKRSEANSIRLTSTTTDKTYTDYVTLWQDVSL